MGLVYRTPFGITLQTLEEDYINWQLNCNHNRITNLILKNRLSLFSQFFAYHSNGKHGSKDWEPTVVRNDVLGIGLVSYLPKTSNRTAQSNPEWGSK